MKTKAKIDTASFLAEHYQQLDSDLATVIRLEELLLSHVYKFSSIYPEECFYSSGWIRLLIMLNKLYSELIPGMEENEAYTFSNKWIGYWTLEMLNLRQGVSPKKINAKLDELLASRQVLLEYIKSDVLN